MKKQKSKIVDGIFYGIEVTIEDEKLIKVHNRDGTKFKDIKPQIDRIDPVGACVGMKGSRIHGIVRELKNENIDVINYTSNAQLLIQRSLSPAKVTSVKLNEETKRAEVFLKPDQISLAIGKGGFNIKLAGKLTGYEIDVFRDNDEAVVDIDDVDLVEFSDEIEESVINALQAIGCDTAKSVLELDVADLVRRTGLTEDVIEDVKQVLQSEFED